MLLKTNTQYRIILNRVYATKWMCTKLTPKPLGRDVLQQGERDAEEGDEQITHRQGADEDVGGTLHCSFPQNYVNHQAVSHQCQDENDGIHDDKCRFYAWRQLWSIDERQHVVSVNEVLACQVVDLKQLLQ